ncbi:hypothetical protein ACNI65_09985 [Roseateles sp. So40a]|uniref:hypothetical protein n=1 Tax=Roseateles sp. So40a TaxID=3400226 RepID=UPI003A8601C1
MSGGKKNETQTTTTSSYYDNRSVVDAGGGIVGNGNVWDQGTYLTSLSSSTDNSVRIDDRSDRSTHLDQSVRIDDSRDFSTRIDDSRDQSIRMEDSRDQSVRISVDGGAISAIERMGLAQTEAAKDIAIKAATSGLGAMDFAKQTQEDAAAFNKTAFARSMDMADSAQKFALTANDAALSFAGNKFDKLLGMAQDVVSQSSKNATSAADVAKSAYQSAADTAAGNKTLIYVAIGAVALVGVVAAAIAFK